MSVASTASPMLSGLLPAPLRFSHGPFCLLPFSNVAGDFRSADDGPVAVAHRRHRQIDINETAIFSSPHGFEILDAIALAKTFKDRGFS